LSGAVDGTTDAWSSIDAGDVFGSAGGTGGLFGSAETGADADLHGGIDAGAGTGTDSDFDTFLG
ncbi:hypothetical protein GQ85_37605, partial [Rhodococcus rhodochrous]